MTLRPGIRPPRRAVLRLVLAGLAAAVVPPGTAHPGGADMPGDPAGAVAVLTYIAWQELEGANLDPTRLRTAAADLFAASLAGQGHRVVPGEALAPLVVRWRLRDGMMLGDEFLAALRGELGADRLLVAQLFLQPGGLLVAWRLVDTGTGLLVGVGTSEGHLDPGTGPASGREGATRDSRRIAPGTEAWLQAAERAAGGLAFPAGRARSGERPDLLVLPLHSVGSEFGATALATHCLLQEMVMARGLALPDPGLVVAALRQAGFDPGRMGSGVRERLRERFGADLVLKGELISYGIVSSLPSPAIPDWEEGGSAAASPLEDFALSLSRIELATGRILDSEEVFDDRPVESGWFGMERRHSLRERLQTALAGLLAGTAAQHEDGRHGLAH